MSDGDDIEDGEILDEDDQTTKNNHATSAPEEQSPEKDGGNSRNKQPLIAQPPLLYEQINHTKNEVGKLGSSSQVRSRRLDKRKKGKIIDDNDKIIAKKKFRPEVKHVESIENEDDMICILGGSLQDSAAENKDTLPHDVRDLPGNDQFLDMISCDEEGNFRPGLKYKDCDRRDAPKSGTRNNGTREESDSEKMCIFFVQGKCNRGSECAFIHALNKPRKMEPCKFYIMDRCSRRDKCTYMHNDFPCKFYHTGAKCFSGKNCKFSHRKLDETHRSILWKYLNKYESNFGEKKNEKHSPSGVGPTDNADDSTSSRGSRKERDSRIPSLFDIKVSIPDKFVDDEGDNESVREDSKKISSNFKPGDDHECFDRFSNNEEYKRKSNYRLGVDYKQITKAIEDFNNSRRSARREEGKHKPNRFDDQKRSNEPYGGPPKGNFDPRLSEDYEKINAIAVKEIYEKLNRFLQNEEQKNQINCKIEEELMKLGIRKDYKANKFSTDEHKYKSSARDHLSPEQCKKVLPKVDGHYHKRREDYPDELVLNKDRENTNERQTPVCSPQSGFSDDEYKRLLIEQETANEKSHKKHKKDPTEKEDGKSNKKKKSKKKSKRSDSEEKRYLEKEIRKLNRKEQKHRQKENRHKNGVQNYDFPIPQKDETNVLDEIVKNETTEDNKILVDAPSHLPKKQQELYLRIQQQQKETGATEKIDMGSDDEEKDYNNEDGNWYSSDEESLIPTSNLNVILDTIKTNCRTQVIDTDNSILTSKVSACEKNNLVETVTSSTIDTTANTTTTDSKLNISNLSDIHISDAVSKILSTIRMQTNLENSSTNLEKPTAYLEASSTILETPFINVEKLQLDFPSDKNVLQNTPATASENKPPLSLGWWNDISNPLETLTTLANTEDTSDELSHQDIDVNNLPFKPVILHETANEIDASITSHLPMEYKLILLDPIPKADYAAMPTSCRIHELDPRFKTSEVPKLVTTIPVPTTESIDSKLSIIPSTLKSTDQRKTDPRLDKTQPNLDVSPNSYAVPNKQPEFSSFYNANSDQMNPTPYLQLEPVKTDNPVRDPRLSRSGIVSNDPRLANSSVNPAQNTEGACFSQTNLNLGAILQNTSLPLGPNSQMNMPSINIHTMPPPTCLNPQVNFNSNIGQNTQSTHNESQIPLVSSRPTDPRIRFKTNLS